MWFVGDNGRCGVAPEVPRWLQWLLVAVGGLSLSALPLAAALGQNVAAAALPAALAAWVVTPLLGIRSLRRRARRRKDRSVEAWIAGLACGPAALAVAVAGELAPHPRLGVALVWLAVWGYGGLIMHGMLSRIVPFLVWFHRLSPFVGKEPVPPVRRLFPQDRLDRSLKLHGAALLVGLLAIATAWPWAARLTGLLLLATAAALGHALLRVVQVRGPQP